MCVGITVSATLLKLSNLALPLSYAITKTSPSHNSHVNTHAMLLQMNDVQPIESVSYLIKYDSVHGTWPVKVGQV